MKSECQEYCATFFCCSVSNAKLFKYKRFMFDGIVQKNAWSSFLLHTNKNLFI